jgi:hypothetical protein
MKCIDPTTIRRTDFASVMHLRLQLLVKQCIDIPEARKPDLFVAVAKEIGRYREDEGYYPDNREYWALFCGIEELIRSAVDEECDHWYRIESKIHLALDPFVFDDYEAI